MNAAETSMSFKFTIGWGAVGGEGFIRVRVKKACTEMGRTAEYRVSLRKRRKQLYRA